MSGKLVGEIFDSAPKDLRPAERLVLLSLAESARDKDRQARYRCSVDELAGRTGASPGTVRNALSELVGRGLILPVHAAVHRGGKHQEYRLAKLTSSHRFATHRDKT